MIKRQTDRRAEGRARPVMRLRKSSHNKSSQYNFVRCAALCDCLRLRVIIITQYRSRNTEGSGGMYGVQICDQLRGPDNNGWTTVWLSEQAVPYMYRDEQWVAFDNVDSVTYKAG